MQKGLWVTKKSFLIPLTVGFVLLGSATGIYKLQGHQITADTIAQILSPTPREEVLGSIDSKALDNVVVALNQRWFLVGDEFSTEEQQLSVKIALNQEQQELLKGRTGVALTYTVNGTALDGGLKETQDPGVYQAVIDTSKLKPAEYTLETTITVGEQTWQQESQTFYVSYPVYVAWTLDWEGYDVKQEYLNNIAELSEKHNHMPLTHFFNPRIYTSGALSAERQQYLTNWVITRQRENNDQIALHMHMYPDMVAASGVTPRENPIKWGNPRDDGYDIITMQYTHEELTQMFNWAQSLFDQKGLGSPSMFRAGGWFANEDTLQAVEAAGFVADSSGRTTYRFGTNNLEGPWTLSTTTQPYQLNINDQNDTNSPNMDIWEFPNNGGDSWAFTDAQMIERFYQNYNQTTITEKKLVTFLSHPEWFYKDYPKMDKVLTETDSHLFSQDKGPVIYITLDEAYQIWQ